MVLLQKCFIEFTLTTYLYFQISSSLLILGKLTDEIQAHFLLKLVVTVRLKLFLGLVVLQSSGCSCSQGARKLTVCAGKLS